MEGVVGSSSDGGNMAGNEIQGPIVTSLKERFVHFDLKGMPPKVEAYKIIFPFLKSIGATGVLLEYEDMFPFHGKLQSIANKQAYSESDIKTILEAAQGNDLQVIPLVQTFGHMEYVLKLEDFADLREHPRYLQCICPSNIKSTQLVEEMIDQVMSLHPTLKYFHMGSDEVYYMGLCQACQDRINKSKLDRGELFLSHATHVASYVKNKHKVQPIMWDDEFRNLDEALIMKYEIGNLVDILVWNYCSDVHNRIGPNVWEKYERIFKSVWIGTAFKGADKPNSLVANEIHYLANHYSWMETISEYQHRVNFKGIFLTGWQRYDHFTILCEIFPVAIPSLVSCMFYLDSVGQQPRMEKITSRAANFLNCDKDLQPSNFPGAEICTNVLTLSSLQATMKNIKEQPVYLGWIHNVNLQHEFNSPSHVESILNHVVKLKTELDGIQTNLLTALRVMFPEWSVQEWMHTHFLPLSTEVNLLEASLSKLFKKETFPVRPLTFTDISSPSLLH
ncbi:Hexosaminidase D [Orchesella cincta]|uniref:beta-N-acetylhexosaminidase n=1 Tax=Orchesella cincta TaxID=48709 RepID=A0A1D2M6Q5_ORCCI|nr:Hexosaminidase D [Orchesella cincta]